MAMNYSGVITRSDLKKYRIKEARLQKTFTLVFENLQLENLFKKLKEHDFISIEGARSSTSTTIRVDSIHYVGLHDLIGNWKGDDNYCYRFKSFTHLIIFPAQKKNCKMEIVAGREYAYTINPTEHDWLLLLSDNQANYVADFILKNSNSVEMSLYDSNTGDILRTIKLRK